MMFVMSPFAAGLLRAARDSRSQALRELVLDTANLRGEASSPAATNPFTPPLASPRTT